MHFFTSINLNYLAKARVLAISVKQHHPDSVFTLMLCERPGTVALDLAIEPFDQVLYLQDLSIPAPSLESWIFGHSVVELCTAVKPFALREIVQRGQGEIVVYLDPDIQVFSPLDAIETHLQNRGVLLTPHLLEPAPFDEEVRLHEISCLKHGVFNLGFVAIHKDRGLRFVDWWCDRLLHYCRADIPQGLFTDQRWVDLSPAFFEEVTILRDVTCNVASWNVSRRDVRMGAGGRYYIGDAPLKFFHFSGFDSGTHDKIIRLLQPENHALRTMTETYRAELTKHGQGDLAGWRWSYGQFDNGCKISDGMRRIYRDSPQMQRHFPAPFSAGNLFLFRYGERLLMARARNMLRQIARWLKMHRLLSFFR